MINNTNINLLEKVYYIIDKCAYEVQIIGISIDHIDGSDCAEVIFKILEGKGKDLFETLSLGDPEDFEKIGNEMQIRSMRFELYSDKKARGEVE